MEWQVVRVHGKDLACPERRGIRRVCCMASPRVTTRQESVLWADLSAVARPLNWRQDVTGHKWVLSALLVLWARRSGLPWPHQLLPHAQEPHCPHQSALPRRCLTGARAACSVTRPCRVLSSTSHSGRWWSPMGCSSLTLGAAPPSRSQGLRRGLRLGGQLASELLRRAWRRFH